MRKLLITGGSGFVGAHIAKEAVSSWDTAAAFYSHPFTAAGISAYKADFGKESEIEHLIELTQPDAVIHAAAESNLDVCERSPGLAHHLNAVSAEILAELSVRYGFRLVFVSSDMVFDGAQGGYGEQDEANPVNVYGRSKLTGERFIQAVARDYVIARAALVYGKPLQSHSRSFSSEVVRRVSGGETMPLFTDQFRSPVHVVDLARALIDLAGGRFQGVIHLGGAERTDRYTFGLRLAAAEHLDPALMRPVSMYTVSFDAPRPVDVSFNTALSAHVLGRQLPGYREVLT
ncbi:NAD(P)-dependent oxidoreductase [bacterium]|nr:NAD(P)-dependent oxidoreductase [bacterium]